jgi:hypothetical protein
MLMAAAVAAVFEALQSKAAQTTQTARTVADPEQKGAIYHSAFPIDCRHT